ncbi:universal stress protein [Microbacterium yannicii]|uniref:Universal stress protein n=1 Tax=Microbacterium yannicii TaxID=671622 RepID=A0ABP9MB46_9MICO|nr:universal stress protein [Microbacterium yannicii]MCO5952793.1 universal stress protein [Microbacterium yannicii]
MVGDAIVVGVTDRPVSQRATDWAADRAAATGRGLELLSVVGGATGAVGEDEVLQRAKASAQALADAEVVRLSGKGLTVRASVSHGNPTEVLIEQSKDAALLVIGSDIRGDDHEKKRGPHGRRIVAGAHCPVVVVPDIDTSDRRGVVVGVDGSDVSQRALEFAAAEAAASGDTLTAVSAWIPVSVGTDYAIGGVSDYPDLYLTDLQQQTERALDELLTDVRAAHPELPIGTYVAEGDPGYVINEAAATARLAVVGTHGRTGIARLLLGSVSEHVLAELVTVTAVTR